MYKTDYLGIHERAYKRIIDEGRTGWSDKDSVQAMVEVISQGIKMQSISSGIILELGCGDGSVSLEMESKGFDVFGIDIVPEAIAWANRKADRQKACAEFQVGEVTNLPYRGKKFDVVVDASCSHCIIGEDRKKFFAEAYRVLKPEGLFILNCLCGDPPENILPYFDTESRCLIKGEIAGRYYGEVNVILEQTKAAGLVNLSWETEENDHEDTELVLFCARKGSV